MATDGLRRVVIDARSTDESQCRGKRAFPTAAAAWRAVQQLGSRKRSRKGAAYRCRCGAWHMTAKGRTEAVW